MTRPLSDDELADRLRCASGTDFARLLSIADRIEDEMVDWTDLYGVRIVRFLTRCTGKPNGDSRTIMKKTLSDAPEIRRNRRQSFAAGSIPCEMNDGTR